MGQPIFAPQMVRKDLRGEFIEAASEMGRPLLIDTIATTINSVSDKENYAWLSEAPVMEEFVDEMPTHTLSDTGLTAQTGSDDPGYEVKNKTYAGALLFRRDDMADEKVGGFRTRIQDQVGFAYSYPDVLLITKLEAGETDTCYIQVGATGEAFFSATHAVRGSQSATWSNLLTGNGTSVANFQTDLGLALSALYNMEGENGQPINRGFRQWFVLYPPAISVNMRTAVLAGVISQTSNVAFETEPLLLPEPLLSDANDFYVGILDAPVRGLVWQEREGLALEEIGVGSEMWTNLRQVEYAVTRRGAAAFGRPQRLIKVSNT